MDRVFDNTHLKNMGWSVNEGAEDSLSAISSLLEKPLWFKPLWVGSEMIGAGSWLPLACLEKLQEISGVAAFFIGTQMAGKPSKNKLGNKDKV